MSWRYKIEVILRSWQKNHTISCSSAAPWSKEQISGMVTNIIRVWNPGVKMVLW